MAAPAFVDPELAEDRQCCRYRSIVTGHLRQAQGNGSTRKVVVGCRLRQAQGDDGGRVGCRWRARVRSALGNRRDRRNRSRVRARTVAAGRNPAGGGCIGNGCDMPSRYANGVGPAQEAEHPRKAHLFVISVGVANEAAQVTIDDGSVRIRLHRRAVALRGQELLGRAGHDRLIALFVGRDRGRPALVRHVGQRAIRSGDRAPELLIEGRELLLRERAARRRLHLGDAHLTRRRLRRCRARLRRHGAWLVDRRPHRTGRRNDGRATVGAVVGNGGSVGAGSSRSRGSCATARGCGCARRRGRTARLRCASRGTVRFSIVIASESATISGVGVGRGSIFATTTAIRWPSSSHAPPPGRGSAAKPRWPAAAANGAAARPVPGRAARRATRSRPADRRSPARDR